MDALSDWVAINFKKGGLVAAKVLKDKEAPTLMLFQWPAAGISEWDLMVLQDEWKQKREDLKIWEENNKKYLLWLYPTLCQN